MSKSSIPSSTIKVTFQYVMPDPMGWGETREMRTIDTGCDNLADAFEVAIKHGADPRKQIKYEW